MATVRYLVDDVARCVPFYVGTLGFEEIDRYGPAIAILRRDDLVLWLAGPVSSAARPMPDGSQPLPAAGPLVLTTEDIDAMVARLRTEGVAFRNDIVEARRRQILIEDRRQPDRAVQPG
jgi:catechol 2,3-dioxygenase-like lactoylglutathione lyase family enzyme